MDVIIWLKCEACLLIQLECREADSSSGEHRLPACNRRQLVDGTTSFRQAAEKDRQVACAPQSLGLPGGEDRYAQDKEGRFPNRPGGLETAAP